MRTILITLSADEIRSLIDAAGCVVGTAWGDDAPGLEIRMRSLQQRLSMMLAAAERPTTGTRDHLERDVLAQAHALSDAWDDWAPDDGFDCDKFKLICTCFVELNRRLAVVEDDTDITPAAERPAEGIAPVDRDPLSLLRDDAAAERPQDWRDEPRATVHHDPNGECIAACGNPIARGYSRNPHRVTCDACRDQLASAWRPQDAEQRDRDATLVASVISRSADAGVLTNATSRDADAALCRLLGLSFRYIPDAAAKRPQEEHTRSEKDEDLLADARSMLLELLGAEQPMKPGLVTRVKQTVAWLDEGLGYSPTFAVAEPHDAALRRRVRAKSGFVYCKDCKGVVDGPCDCMMYQDGIDTSRCEAHRDSGRVGKCKCGDALRSAERPPFRNPCPVHDVDTYLGCPTCPQPSTAEPVDDVDNPRKLHALVVRMGNESVRLREALAWARELLHRNGCYNIEIVDQALAAAERPAGVARVDRDPLSLLRDDGAAERPQDAPMSALLDALERAALLECERAIQQARRFWETGERTASHGGGWDTCFRYVFERVLTEHGDAPRPAELDALVRVRALLQRYTEYGVAHALVNDLRRALDGGDAPRSEPAAGSNTVMIVPTPKAKYALQAAGMWCDKCDEPLPCRGCTRHILGEPAAGGEIERLMKALEQTRAELPWDPECMNCRAAKDVLDKVLGKSSKDPG